MQLQIEGVKQAPLLETREGNLDRSPGRGGARCKPFGVEGGGAALSADRGMGLSSLEVMP